MDPSPLLTTLFYVGRMTENSDRWRRTDMLTPRYTIWPWPSSLSRITINLAPSLDDDSSVCLSVQVDDTNEYDHLMVVLASFRSIRGRSRQVPTGVTARSPPWSPQEPELMEKEEEEEDRKMTTEVESTDVHRWPTMPVIKMEKPWGAVLAVKWKAIVIRREYDAEDWYFMF